MSEFSPEYFHESIDDMCDDAIRRMYAFQEGGLSVMQDGDCYESIVTKRDSTLGLIEYETVTRAEIVDQIHDEVIAGEVPDYALEIVGGAIRCLSRHAAFRGRRSTVLVPSVEDARSYGSEVLTLNSSNRFVREPVRLFSQELGSLGLTSLILQHNKRNWDLSYEAVHRVSLLT